MRLSLQSDTPEFLEKPRELPITGAEQPLRPRSSRIAFACLQAGLSLVLTTIVRVILLVKYGPSAGVSAAETTRLFLVGAHADLAIALALWLPLMLWLTLIPDRWLNRRWHRNLLWGTCGVWWGLQIFLAIAEVYFFDEYRSRFNTVAIDYVHYWTEVSGNIMEMYPVFDIVLACVVGAFVATFLSWNLARPNPGSFARTRFAVLAVWVIGLGVSASTYSMREVQFSRERLVNEIANNGLASGLTALWTRDLDYGVFYPTLPRDEAWALARKAVATPGSTLSSDPHSLQRSMAGDPNKPKLNVVLMLEESLGSEFWGCLNGVKPKKSLTPNLDRIATTEGMLFDHILADGNRTIRGIEAVLASFPPLPGDSIVARTRTHNVETLGQVLRRDGYATTFIYPGSGLFDGLRPFALDNGFDRMIEQRDFKDPAFKTVWGVCNEDLYDRALAEARAAHQSGQPFFITTLSVTNHQPFTYPEGRIPQPPHLRSRKNAVRYVDYAFGRFFEQAKKEEFWKDTIFVVVADHGARVYGSQTIPIHSYEVPFLVVGPAAVSSPQLITTPGCQLDVAPTILGMIGRPYETTFFGHDLRSVPENQQRALINHNRSIGIYRGNRLVTFGLNKTIDVYEGTPWTDFKPLPQADDAADLVAESTALYQVADELYTQERYRVIK